MVVEGDLAVAHVTMSGRDTGTFVGYEADGHPADVFPATGKPFAATQSHWMRFADGKIVEHCANRDALGQTTQTG